MSIELYRNEELFNKLKNKYSPYNDRVPKDLATNLRYRRAVIEEGYESRNNGAALFKMCSKDILFFCNTFVWTYHSKDMNFPEYPFICFPFQEEALLNVLHCIDVGQDIFTDKSRDMGASWIYLIAITWLWLFKEMSSCLLLSRKEEYVDKAGDPKSLFWKIDYIIKKLPRFLRPRFNRNNLHLENINNGATIEGESTNSNAGRGDRKLVILMDEFADVKDGFKLLSATADVTNCRIFNSTYSGSGNAFYEISRWDSLMKLRFHWSQHPEKGEGLYRVNKDKTIDIIDKEWHEKNPGYEFKLDHGYYDGLHSPWYDKECTRRTMIEIKEQLDIDPHGSGAMFFDANMVDDLIDNKTIVPYFVGNLEYDLNDKNSKPCFKQNSNGYLSLWFPVRNGELIKSHHNTVMGIDISAGTGASNSVICVYDIVTGDKLVEYVNSKIKPWKLAKLAMAISRFLSIQKQSHIIWEANGGGGREFTDQIIEDNYSNIYYKTDDESIGKKISDKPGFYSNTEKKKALLGLYSKCLLNEYIKNYSKRACSELREYIFDDNGNVVHSRQLRSEDPSGAKDNHGDIVIADALCAKIINERKELDNIKNKLDNLENIPEFVPRGCAMHRIKERRMNKKLVRGMS